MWEKEYIAAPLSVLQANGSLPLQCLHKLTYSTKALMSDCSSLAFVPEPSNSVFALCQEKEDFSTPFRPI